MKKTILTIAAVVVLAAALFNVVKENKSNDSPELALGSDRANSDYYKNQKASLETALRHADTPIVRAHVGVSPAGG